MVEFTARHWIFEEFNNIDFGDHRLNARFLKTALLLSEKPNASINRTCLGRSQIKGAYRMFKNDRVNLEEIFAAHEEKTIERICNTDSVVLAIQDTSFLNYTSHTSKKGFGHICTVGKVHSQGLVMHTTLAISSTGRPLGVLKQDIWSRNKLPNARSSHERKISPIEQKESMKWIHSLRNCSEIESDLKRKIVTVADRESDIFEFIHEAEKLKSDFLIRAVRDRVVTTSTGDISSVWSELESQPSAGTIDLLVPAKVAQKKRYVKLDVKFCSLTINPPIKKKILRDLGSTTVYGILVKERKPPKGVVPLEWVLLTSLEVNSFKQAVEKVEWYKRRWQIEIFHKILKSVCRVEECRMQTSDQIKKFVLLSSVNAWRIYWMTYASREIPEESYKLILEEYEWKILQAITKDLRNKKIVKPTIREAVRLIAQLGGFLARKSDGEPGVLTIARGWETLKTMSENWHRLKEINIYG